MSRPLEVNITIHRARRSSRGIGPLEWRVLVWPAPKAYADGYVCSGVRYRLREDAIKYARECLVPMFVQPRIWVGRAGDDGPGYLRESFRAWRKTAKEVKV